jgi:hypothetical protein
LESGSKLNLTDNQAQKHIRFKKQDFCLSEKAYFDENALSVGGLTAAVSMFYNRL